MKCTQAMIGRANTYSEISMKPLRICFMGSPDFAVPVLNALCQTGHTLVAVYTQPPKPAKRGKQIQKTAVHMAAEQLGIQVLTPKNFKNETEQNFFKNLECDLVVVVAYGLILPQSILNIPPLGCINIHYSLLPRWRGAAPVARAMLAGDETTGVCVMQMDAGLDTGNILAKQILPIQPTDTQTTLLEKLTTIGTQLTLDTICKMNNGTATSTPQSQEGVCLAQKLTREDGLINWSSPAEYILRQVHALTPWPGCYFNFENENIKVHAAQIIKPDKPSQSLNLAAEAGTLVDENFTIACGSGFIQLTRLQKPGKAMTDGASVLRGWRLKPGFKFK